MELESTQSKTAVPCMVRQPGFAWLILTLVLGVHVVDEALNGFLDVYNPAVRALRSQIPLLPLPTFTFDIWITGLLLAVAALLFLSRYAFREARWMRPVSTVYGMLMLGNALLHLAGSVALGRFLPGVWSAPFLAAAALTLLVSVLGPVDSPAQRQGDSGAS